MENYGLGAIAIVASWVRGVVPWIQISVSVWMYSPFIAKSSNSDQTIISTLQSRDGLADWLRDAFWVLRV